LGSDGSLMNPPGSGAEALGAKHPETRRTLPLRHLGYRPGADARAALHGEVEAKQGWQLAGLGRTLGAGWFLDHKCAAGPQRAGHAAGKVTVLICVEVVREVGHQHEIELLNA